MWRSVNENLGELLLRLEGAAPEIPTEYEIYSTMPGAARANAAIVKAVAALRDDVLATYKAVDVGPKFVRAAIKKHIDPVFTKLSKYGTLDGEPMGVVEWYLKRLLISVGAIDKFTDLFEGKPDPVSTLKAVERAFATYDKLVAKLDRDREAENNYKTSPESVRETEADVAAARKALLALLMSEGKGPGGEDRPGYSWEPTERGMGFWTQDDSDGEDEDQRYTVVGLVTSSGRPFSVEASKEYFVATMKMKGFDFLKWNDSPKQRPELQGQPRFKGLAGPLWGGPAQGIRYETPASYKALSK